MALKGDEKLQPGRYNAKSTKKFVFQRDKLKLTLEEHFRYPFLLTEPFHFTCSDRYALKFMPQFFLKDSPYWHHLSVQEGDCYDFIFRQTYLSLGFMKKYETIKCKIQNTVNLQKIPKYCYLY